MDIAEKGDVGVSTTGKGEGELMNADEMRLAEMGANWRQVSMNFC
jgi:hypothetical protein